MNSLRRGEIMPFQYSVVMPYATCLGPNECTWAYIGGKAHLKFINRLCSYHGSIR